MTFWVSTLIVGFVTLFVFRGGFIIFKPTKPFPKIVEDFLDYVPVAAMFAIAGTHMIFIQDEDMLDFAPDKILAGVVTFVAAWFSRNLFVTLAVGMSSLWLIHYFV